MNKKTIEKTAICRFDQEDQLYIVESPLCDLVIGVGETEEEASLVFIELLDETYVSYLEGNLYKYKKPGRPKKNKVDLRAQVSVDVKRLLEGLAKDLNTSFGGAVEYVSFLHSSGGTPIKKRQTKARRNKIAPPTKKKVARSRTEKKERA